MSLTVDIKDVSGKKTGTFALPAEIFDVQVNIPLIHQVVTAQLAAARQGSHKAKNRGEVSGGGKKPFKQKGTGRTSGFDSFTKSASRCCCSWSSATSLRPAHTEEDDQSCARRSPL